MSKVRVVYPRHSKWDWCTYIYDPKLPKMYCSINLEPQWPLFLKVNPSKTRPFPIKTGVIWVLGIYQSHFSCLGYPHEPSPDEGGGFSGLAKLYVLDLQKAMTVPFFAQKTVERSKIGAWGAENVLCFLCGFWGGYYSHGQTELHSLKNGGFLLDFPFARVYFQERAVSFREGS